MSFEQRNLFNPTKSESNEIEERYYRSASFLFFLTHVVVQDYCFRSLYLCISTKGVQDILTLACPENAFSLVALSLTA